MMGPITWLDLFSTRSIHVEVKEAVVLDVKSIHLLILASLSSYLVIIGFSIEWLFYLMIVVIMNDGVLG